MRNATPILTVLALAAVCAAIGCITVKFGNDEPSGRLPTVVPLNTPIPLPTLAPLIIGETPPQQGSLANQPPSAIPPTIKPTATPIPWPTLASDPTAPPAPTPAYTSRPYPTAAPAEGQTASPTPPPTKVASPLAKLKNDAYVKQQYPAVYRRLTQLPWIQDGLDPVETSIAQNLLYLPVNAEDDQALTALLELGWMRQNQNAHTADIIASLKGIAYHNGPAAAKIAAMPFLRDISPGDREALESLSSIAYQDENRLSDILQHPTLAGGIYDSWTPVIAALESADKYAPNLIDNLLSPDHGTLDSRTIPLPLGGTVLLSVVRTGEYRSASDTMDLLAEAVRQVERIMDTPLPATAVILVFAEAVTPGYHGTNFGSHIVVRPTAETGEGYYTEEQRRARMFRTLTHEVAHYYWTGRNNWLDEGMAETVEMKAAAQFLAHPEQPDQYPCVQADSLAQLEALDPGKQDNAYSCNYSLGGRFFLNLYQQNHQFWPAIRAVYISYRDHPDMSIQDIADALSEYDMDKTARRTYRDGVPGILIADAVPTHRIDDLNADITDVFVAPDSDCDQRFANYEINVHNAPPVYLCTKYKYNGSRNVLVTLNLTQIHESDGYVYNSRIYSHQWNTSCEYTNCTWTGQIALSVGPGTNRQWKPGKHILTLTNPSGKTATVVTLTVKP